MDLLCLLLSVSLLLNPTLPCQRRKLATHRMLESTITWLSWMDISALGWRSPVKTCTVEPSSKPLSAEQYDIRLTRSELGLATHYVEPDALQLLIGEVAQLSNPTITSISSIISASTPSTPSASSINSKSNPDGTSVIKGEIREFLDKTFRSKSVKEIYEKLQSAESNQVLSEEVRAWAKEQREYMDARSPTGMAVALEGYRRARSVKRLDVTLKNGQYFDTCRFQS